MSEGSKMGLFGSKEEKQESTASDETAQPVSPGRYAPYCIDSDSETYDTEALSIMDINDIIGVQSGQAAESTLESEIAALSEIMTDSKGEGNTDKTNPTSHGSSDLKFSKKLITDFNAACSSSRKESLGEQSIATEKCKDPSSRDSKKDDKVPVRAEDAASNSVQGNVDLEDKKVESAPENEDRDGALAAPGIHESKDCETETVSDAVSQANAESLEGSSEAVDNDGDLTKSDKVSTVSVQDPVRDVESTAEMNPAGEEPTVYDPEDEKLGEGPTNVCSFANSLQLIGEAYISEDSQDMDDEVESPVKEVASLSLERVEEEKTIDQDIKPCEEASFETKTQTDESKSTVAADTSESAVVACNLDHQDNTPSDDNKESDNTNEVSPNLENNRVDGSKDSTSESVANVQSEDEKVDQEDLPGEINANEREKFEEITSVPKNTEVGESIEKEEEPSQEIQHSEETAPNTGTEAVLEILNADSPEREGNQNPDELMEGICQQPKLSDKGMEVDETDDKTSETGTETPVRVDNSSTVNIEPRQEPENSFNTSFDNRTAVDSEIHIESIEVSKSVQPAAPVDERSIAASVESNNENESMDSKISEKSASSLQQLNADDTSESSTSPAEILKNLKDKDHKLTNVTMPRDENSGGILDDVEQISEIMRVNTEQYIVDDVIKEEDLPIVTEAPDVKKHEEKDEHTSIHKMIESIRKQEAKMESESNEKRSVNESQFVCMKSTSMVVETGIDSSNDMTTNEEDATTEQSQGKIEVIQDLTAELGQSASTSSMENDESSFNLMKLDKPDRRKLLEKFSEVDESNSTAAVADSRSSEVVEANLDLQKDDYMDIGRAELSEPESSQSQIQIEVPISLQIEAPEAEFVSDVKSQEASDSTTGVMLGNISPANVELESLEPTEHNLLDDSSNQQEITQKPPEPGSIDESQKVDTKILGESENVGNDRGGVSRIEASEGTTELKESESISEPPADAEMKQAGDPFDKDDKKSEENKTITDPGVENIAVSTNIETNPGVNYEDKKDNLKIEVSLQDDGLVVPDNQQRPDSKILPAEKSEDVQYQGSSDDAKMETEAELSSTITVDEKENDPGLQPEKLEEKADSLAEPDGSLRSATDDEQIEGSVRTERGADTDSQIVSAVSEDVSKLLEKEEDKLIPMKPLDEKNLDDTSNVYSSAENLESSQTPSGITEGGEDFEDTVSFKLDAKALALQSDNLMELDVKMDKDLQSEPIRGLEGLTEGADETLFDEIANSVLKEATVPLGSIANLEVLPDSLLLTSTIVSSEEPKETDVFSAIKIQPELLLDEINETSLIGDLNETPSISHGATYVTDVITSPTNIEALQLEDNIVDMDDKNVIADDSEFGEREEAVKADEILTEEDITDISEACKLDIEDLALDKDIGIDSPVKVEDKLIASAVLEACGEKIDLPDEVLFTAEDAEGTDVLCTPADNVDTSQQSSEFSELECAVKFLQESEEQTIDSPLLLSPKIAEEIVEDNSAQSKSCLFLSETEVCQETLELRAESEEITPDSIAISEAEIISEAAKLENERKLKLAAEVSETLDDVEKVTEAEEIVSLKNSEMLKSLLTTTDVPSWRKENLEQSTASTPEKSVIPLSLKRSEKVIRSSEKIPKVSILEERLKEPPKIEIPVPEGSPRISDTPTTPKTSLLMQRDSRADTKSMHQKMLESPKGSDRSEPKIADTPRKDSEKHDFENVGSPRIILKIAKSAIADCGEPRSPKSPKIRSAANSPNPEDSPGQKLGKIKLKLSRGGHPSIISNENFDETAQRHTEAILSPSHIGMKIKLSKSGDASIIQPDKHDSNDEAKESKHKYDDVSPKRIESPLGMKIKLSKTGDPSIVQQESKESSSKRKEKLDVGQEMPKRTDSPIGMKIKLSKSGDASIIQPEKQDSSEDKFDNVMEIPKRTESPIGMKIKLSKSGDASIISSESCDEFKESSSKSRDKLGTNQDIPKRNDSPLGMKFKLSKSGGASIIQPDKPEAFEEFKDRSENMAEITKRVESPIGMKIKLSKTGDASIIHPDKQESEDHREAIIIKHRDKSEIQDTQKRTDSPLGMRIKVTKSGEASVVSSEEFKESSSLSTESYETTHDGLKRNESPIGVKIKLSKTGDASIIHPERQEFYDERGFQEGSKPSDSPLGMKIKLSRTGDASIIHREASPDSREGGKRTDSPFGMKIKLSRTGDASIIESATKQKEKSTEGSQKRKDSEFPLEMKIKLSKTGHPTIIANEKQESLAELHSKSKDHSESSHHKRTESLFHSTIMQSNRSDVTIEPIQMHQKPENSTDISQKSKDILMSPVDVKKSKLEAKLSHMLPEVTIQPVMSGEQKQISLDKKSSSISRQQMSVINQEISITQVPLSKPADLSMSGKLKEILRKNASNSPASSDCEIIEHRPELIIVNENSNSSQDIMIIEEVKAPVQEIKVPRKRGRPKRSSLPPGQTLLRPVVPQDPLALDNMQGSAEHRESDRPKRTCRSQKSYAPPKRGRGRGRGKRKMDRLDCAIGKIPRLEDPLTAIERSTMSLIAPLQPKMMPEATAHCSELYKALNQSPADRKRLISETAVAHVFPDGHKKMRLEAEAGAQLASVSPAGSKLEEHLMPRSIVGAPDSKAATISGMLQLTEPIPDQHDIQKIAEAPKPENQEAKNIIDNLAATEHQNWLTPSIKLPESTTKTEAMSMVQVMDEETRMSAESNSRSQTPARNISIPVVETVINEESQGSVLSTATTESEKVKVRNRRMEINFDPDEGPFTVDKIAEYEWPPDKKGDTFMIQEQISQYLGVKSFKRKYPDLKRRMVEMEERNYLRENCLVSEAMCDMGLTAICSPEVLDIMCSDFPDQYEEYRKHMREKQAKEHSKKQKELTAAANAERNRIDLAEMAVQSALSWNVNFNKARKESRKYSLDLQSFTIHQPKKQLKVDPERKASNYPVALIPGQYTDYYREYTPAELRYYPLNTVLYGPMRPNERKFDSQSEGSQSDSDSDSSSDDSSSSSSEGTQDTEESQSTVDDVDMELAAHKEDNKNLKCKMCLKHLNKHGKAEVLIQCGTCNGNVHPSCIDLTLDMVPHIQGYSWQCTDCKTCVQCHNPADEDKMLFCDMCDRGYHIYCVGLRRVPQGRWHCRECAVCASCGLRQPGGANSDRNSVAQWQHEYKKGERNTRVYVSTLCVPCSKLWRKGRYCPHCSRCHSAQRLDLEPSLIHCGACDKYLHLGCVEIKYGSIDRKNYICECCSTPNISRSLISKSYRT